MRVLILGGTTFFGKQIAVQLAKGGHQVGLFTRGKTPPPVLAGEGHVHFVGNRENLSDLQQAATSEKWDAVIDNIAYGAAHVEAALNAFSQVPHYVLCSTVAVYRYIPDRFAQPMAENAVDYGFTPPGEDLKDVHWAYARGKLEAEKVCASQGKVPWTILRPPVVYGPEDPTERGYWYLARLIRGGPVLLADGGVQSFRLAYSEDTARAFVQVVEQRKRTEGKTYFLGQAEVITLGDFVRESARALGVLPKCLSVPSGVLGEMGGPYAGMVNLLPSIQAAQTDFGFAPTPWETFARETALWFRDKWKGDWDRLLLSRERELALAAKWNKWLETPQ